MNQCSRLPALFFATLLPALTSGCQNADIADSFVSEEAGWSKRSVPATIALYIPNRIVDTLDLIHLGVGVGPGLGVGLHATREGYLLADAGANAGIGWLGRYARPYRYGLYVRARAAGFEPPGRLPDSVDWYIPRWDISLFADALFVQVYFGLAPDEFVDFFAGWSTYDLKGDDW